MKSFIRRSLLTLAVTAMIAGSATSDAVAQRELIGTPADIPTAGAGTAAAYYDAVSGDVHLAIGDNILIVGLEGASFINANVDETTGLGAPSQNDPGGIGFLDFGGLSAGTFNIGQILAADPSIMTGAQFDATFGNGGAPAFRYSEAGQPEVSVPFTVITTAIPEPGTISLLALAGLGAVARRRR